MPTKKKTKFKDLVEVCSSDSFACSKCQYKLSCQVLQLNGIPKPYQYKNINASILEKNIDELEKSNSFRS